MPPAIYTQNIIAVVWDFDKTLTHGYMQQPLFGHFGVDPATFWEEVNSLAAYYAETGLLVAADSVYLNHILSYVKAGVFAGLNNRRLRDLGGDVVLAPGLPEAFERWRSILVEDGRYRKHEIRLEHYVVSTGLRAMIAGSAIAREVDGIWACDLLPEAAPPGYLSQILTCDSDGELSQVGYVIDNTSKTRAIFEINKGVNVQEGVNVNTLIPEDQRRVPIRNMIYVADGPSDIPSFSVVNRMGGKTLGVYAPGEANYENAALLEEQGRVNSIAAAEYGEGSAADRWLTRSIKQIASEICFSRERILTAYASAPGHVI